jgi:streptomycin 6-kinase
MEVDRTAWVARLPHAIAELEERWHLSIGERFDGEGDASWVATVVRRDGSPAVLKLGTPHMEAEHEADGLRFWDGDPTVRLLEADDTLGAMLLERCEPGTPLRQQPEPEQDVVLAELLRRLRKTPPAHHPFRPLRDMVERWLAETWAHRVEWPDETLVRAGIDEFKALADSEPAAVLLATDLHAGNVLRADREPWLVIDPKPFVGDPAYDATQHLLNCHGRVSADPLGMVARFADLMNVDADRVRRWLFARLSAGPRDDWTDDRWLGVAKIIARGG